MKHSYLLVFTTFFLFISSSAVFGKSLRTSYSDNSPHLQEEVTCGQNIGDITTCDSGTTGGCCLVGGTWECCTIGYVCDNSGGGNSGFCDPGFSCPSGNSKCFGDAVCCSSSPSNTAQYICCSSCASGNNGCEGDNEPPTNRETIIIWVCVSVAIVVFLVICYGHHMAKAGQRHYRKPPAPGEPHFETEADLNHNIQNSQQIAGNSALPHAHHEHHVYTPEHNLDDDPNAPPNPYPHKNRTNHNHHDGNHHNNHHNQHENYHNNQQYDNQQNNQYDNNFNHRHNHHNASDSNLSLQHVTVHHHHGDVVEDYDEQPRAPMTPSDMPIANTVHHKPQHSSATHL